MSELSVPAWLSIAFVAVEYVIKIVAIGVVPENRRPSSSQAWLLLILVLPVVGLPLFLLIGSPYVQGRRHRIQANANAMILDRTSDLPALPPGIAASDLIAEAVKLNRNLSSLPCLLGTPTGLFPGYGDSIAAMTEAVRTARGQVNFEIYILALDATTAPFFDAMTAAVRRGVKVRVLYDHLGSRGYPGFRAMNRRMTADGIDWHQMLPIKPLQGRWRRPDLRNHRKLLVVDEEVGFMGSQNMIDSSYLKKKHVRAGRHWQDLNVRLTGSIVDELSAVFAIDWYTETDEMLDVPSDPREQPGEMAMQLLPSGPGFNTDPGLRLFNSLIYTALRRVTIVSPYFIPDESLLLAITTAAHRGVDVELFASAQADQFMVHHAQRSYYRALLEAGVRVWLYPAPTVLHTKFLTVDEDVAVIGSSNMDMRSFHLDYEISLMVPGSEFVGQLQIVAQQYRDVSQRLDLDSWNRRPWPGRYVDNVMRLTSALQ
ncbi:MAG TPA: cardiolipin synthase [Propionibacteriaceae bacterium]|nr:cardiolipin synthase [Propionibacteriaceae bacterium]